MTDAKLKTSGVALISIAGLLFSGMTSAQDAEEGWKFSAMPYVWLPGVNADLNYGPPADGNSAANISTDEFDLLSNLQMAFMIAGEARKGPWFAVADYLYLHLGKTDSKLKSVDFNPGSGPINVSTTQAGGDVETAFKGSIWSLAGGYAVIDDSSLNLDVLAGFRFLDLEISGEWDLDADVTLPNSTQTFNRSGDAKKTGSVTTFIVGAKGQFKLGQSNWFIPYYADVGGDGSTYTWQLASGLGYRFDWGDVRLDYRHLAYGQDDDELMQKIALSGFMLGANFRF